MSAKSNDLKKRLTAQLNANRPSTWSDDLLAIVSHAIAIEFGQAGEEVTGGAGRPRLTLVGKVDGTG